MLGVDLASPPLTDEEAAQAVSRSRQAAGATVAWCAEGRSTSPLGVPLYDHLSSAIDKFEPAVLSLHAGKVVPAQIRRLDLGPGARSS